MVDGTNEWLSPAGEGGIAARGDWVLANARSLNRLVVGARRNGTVDRVSLSGIGRVDTAGAHLLLELAGQDVSRLRDAPEQIFTLIERIASARDPEPPMQSGRLTLSDIIVRLGAATSENLQNTAGFISFIGAAVAASLWSIIRPHRVRWTAMVHHMEQAGLNALPIVGLISFLIGIVLAFQGATQLQRFGAEIFVVDLVGVSTLREIGILLTAIVVAGRSGSSFAAQLGSMKVNEEVDAMRAMGLDPMHVLVLPRMMALLIMMPCLALFADLMGLLGGGLMSWLALGISPDVFVARLGNAVTLGALMVGLAKAPVFGALVALIGCYEGLRTGGSAESLGRQTTVAVVEGIFIVIVVDAVFSIFFNIVGI